MTTERQKMLRDTKWNDKIRRDICRRLRIWTDDGSIIFLRNFYKYLIEY
jgi:hypothetical protein